jgi:bacillithiol biosynthesis deacetylase BshB1
MNKIDILVFSPHPDDAEIGCGALLLKAQSSGLRTAIIDMSMGERATLGTPETRLCERARATKLLGLEVRECLDMPDTEIGQYREHQNQIINAIRKHRPRIVLAPNFHDRHPDHDAASMIIKRAVFFANISKVGKDKPHRTESLYHYAVHEPFTPSIVLDISSVWIRYCELITSYKSQFDTQKNQDTNNLTALNDGSFIDSIASRARNYGAMIGAQFGEAYFCEQPLALQNPEQFFNENSKAQGYNSFR